MTVAPDPRPLPYAEYLALERAGDTKHEYVNGEVYAMAGGTPEHGRLAMAVGAQLTAALRGSCRVFSSDVRVRVEATGRAGYPDVSVVCGPVARALDDADAITNPSVLVEVLSPSTEATDRGEKWAHYQRLPSLRAYVLVSQTEPRVEVFRRAEDGWRYEEARAGAVLLLGGETPVALDVGELYRDALLAAASEGHP